MAFVAAAIGGGAILGGAFMQQSATRDAAKKQAEAADRAMQLQYEMFQQQRKDAEPWRQAGGVALSKMGSEDFQRDFKQEDFQQDPGYQFRMLEGQKALERSAAARGGLQSGATLKALSRYGQDFASNEYGNAYNRFNADRDRRYGRLSTLAGYGQGANSMIGAAGQNYANNYGNTMMSAANAAGAAGIANANTWGSALGKLGQIGMDSYAASNNNTGGGGNNWMNTWDANQSSAPKYSGGRSYGLMGRS